ncbi:hypothetical protein LOTGIDRAFT_175819 [Lottia gigantea]|uniref:Uncharacterized protein n=1 Tax=Lottia gigantea TaxID=225164 RepID=V4BNU3_LOTGI|nr:hypothetical protein LOTGIDRAFT_175819 [Lottia gigantea]ESO90574.1 hypothetical protein LOTGIDRAFT_175819 [Lottia gigantea]
MRLVPADEPEKIVTVKPYEPVYDQNPVKEALEELSQEMQRLLKSNTSDDIKMDQYDQMLQRYRILQNKRHARTIPETTNNKPDDIASVEKPDILTSVPKTYQGRARMLLEHLEKKTPYSWNDKYELTHGGQVMKGTNVVDIVNDFIRNRKTNNTPFGWEAVMRSLRESNIPREAIGNDRRWELFSTPQTQPSPPAFETPKKRTSKKQQRKERKWLSFDSL